MRGTRFLVATAAAAALIVGAATVGGATSTADDTADAEVMVEVELLDLPSGLRAEPATIPPRSTGAALMLSASEDAASAPTRFRRFTVD